MRASLASWRTSLSAALGLAVACGGNSTFDSGSEDGMTGGAGGTRTVTGIDLRCHNPTVLRGIDGVETGFVSCDAGFVHRAERRDCASTLPRTGLVIEAPPGPVHVTCSTDADCSGIPNGYCAVEDVSSQGTRVRCVQGCIRDDDCAANQLCLCGDPVGMCVWAECWSDADCGGLLCTTSLRKDACSSLLPGSRFACQSTSDQCAADADCVRDDRPYGTCLDSPGRTCGTGGSCGRPFLVEGKARLPEVVRRDTGWSTETSLHVAALDPATRRELAEHYAHLGVMEHASVAAFARFTLELLSLGAPATLVADAQRALGDEIRHAEACFGLASAYAGETLGPGPLSCEGALEHAGSFEAIVETAFAEACIGETLAAVEAAEAAEHATDPVVRRVLLGIAEDERRHAELGWRFVTWALEHSRGVERARLERRLADIVARSRNETLDGSSARNDASVLLAHGKLTAELRVEARRAAFDELVTPLSQGIFQARAA